MFDLNFLLYIGCVTKILVGHVDDACGFLLRFYQHMNTCQKNREKAKFLQFSYASVIFTMKGDT